MSNLENYMKQQAISYIRIKINFVEVKLRLTLYCISMK